MYRYSHRCRYRYRYRARTVEATEATKPQKPQKPPGARTKKKYHPFTTIQNETVRSSEKRN